MRASIQKTRILTDKGEVATLAMPLLALLGAEISFIKVVRPTGAELTLASKTSRDGSLARHLRFSKDGKVWSAAAETSNDEVLFDALSAFCHSRRLSKDVGWQPAQDHVSEQEADEVDGEGSSSAHARVAGRVVGRAKKPLPNATSILTNNGMTSRNLADLVNDLGIRVWWISIFRKDGTLWLHVSNGEPAFYWHRAGGVYQSAWPKDDRTLIKRILGSFALGDDISPLYHWTKILTESGRRPSLSLSAGSTPSVTGHTVGHEPSADHVPRLQSKPASADCPVTPESHGASRPAFAQAAPVLDQLRMLARRSLAFLWFTGTDKRNEAAERAARGQVKRPPCG